MIGKGLFHQFELDLHSVIVILRMQYASAITENNNKQFESIANQKLKKEKV